MMNKIFEIIEAKKIFDIGLNKFEILIHPKSYVHAIVKLKNGLIKIIAHDTTMKIPIFNSQYSSKKIINSKKLDLKKLNNLDFRFANQKKFPINEKTKVIPKNIYAATKKINEEIGEDLSKISNMKVIGLRFFTVYGKYGRPDMFVFKYLESLI